MSVGTNQTEDTSTKNADWGTAVILLVVVIIGSVIAWVAISNRRAPQPAMTLLNAPQSAAPTAPLPADVPAASIVPEAGRADAPGMAAAQPGTAPLGTAPSGPGKGGPSAIQPNGASSSQAPGNGLGTGTADQGATVGGPGGMGGAPNGSSAGPSGGAGG